MTLIYIRNLKMQLFKAKNSEKIKKIHAWKPTHPQVFNPAHDSVCGHKKSAWRFHHADGVFAPALEFSHVAKPFLDFIQRLF